MLPRGMVGRQGAATPKTRVTVGRWQRTSSAVAGARGSLPIPRRRGRYPPDLGLALLITTETTWRGETPLPFVVAVERPGPAHALIQSSEGLLDPFAFPGINTGTHHGAPVKPLA